MRKLPNNKSSGPIRDLHDPVAERNIISGLFGHGSEIFFDIDNLVAENDFFFPENKLVYSAIAKLIKTEGVTRPQVSAVLTSVNTIDQGFVAKYSLEEYLNILVENKLTIENVMPSAIKVSKLGKARDLLSRLLQSADKLKALTGEESLMEIAAIAEEPIVAFTKDLTGVEEEAMLSEELAEYIEFLSENKPAIAGISSGFSLYDKYIGGALRYPGYHLIGGRAKAGKSQILLNIAHNVSYSGIPVLFLDTEMTKEMTLGRWSALITDVATIDIETGAFSDNMNMAEKVSKSIKKVVDKKVPFYYKNISGRPHQEWMSVIRRWIMREVGFNKETGTVNPCLVVIDYIKMMDVTQLGKLAEHQYLGQIANDLHNLCVEYNIAAVVGVQLNRDGITREDQGVIAGSDKLIGLCTSFTIIKKKTPEDLVGDPETNGNRKLIVGTTRFGPGTDDGVYINLKCDFSKSKIIEGNLNSENRRTGRTNVTLNTEPSEPADFDC